MAGVDHRILSFTQGIEEVSLGGFTEARLPDTPRLIPWDGQSEAHVAQLLQTPSREDDLVNALCPEGLTGAMVSPERFRRSVRTCGEGLRRAMEEHPALAEAAAVLDDIDTAVALLEAYRNALRPA